MHSIFRGPLPTGGCGPCGTGMASTRGVTFVPYAYLFAYQYCLLLLTFISIVKQINLHSPHMYTNSGGDIQGAWDVLAALVKVYGACCGAPH